MRQNVRILEQLRHLDQINADILKQMIELKKAQRGGSSYRAVGNSFVPGLIGGRTMRFIIGQAFECTVDGRQAAVDEISDDGRAATRSSCG